MSNCLWAAAHLFEVDATVLMAVPALATSAELMAATMEPAYLVNSLWAAAVLHGSAPLVVKAVAATAERISCNVQDLTLQQVVGLLLGSGPAARCGTADT